MVCLDQLGLLLKNPHGNSKHFWEEERKKERKKYFEIRTISPNL